MLDLSAAKISPTGAKNAKIIVICEFPDQLSVKFNQPFSDEGGKEMTKMMHEAGIALNECYITYVHKRPVANNDGKNLFLDARCKKPSPELQASIASLREELLTLSPNIIIALGSISLYALSGESSITSWRSSLLEETLTGRRIKILPTFSASTILRQWQWRSFTVFDLSRARRESDTSTIAYPDFKFAFPGEFSNAHSALLALYAKLCESTAPIRLACDIETIRHEISCCGFAWSTTEALCIPLRTSREYWTEDEEAVLVQLMRKILTHPNAKIVGQNFLYDAQYFARKWLIYPNADDDTMFMMHVLWSGLPKDLAFISSLYCENYIYWKDELKNYKKAPDDDIKYFSYNCKDVCATWEAANAMDVVLDKSNLRRQYQSQMRVWHAAFRAMLRGIRIDKKFRNKLSHELLDAAIERDRFITNVVGYPLNPKSPKQMQQFLYIEQGLPPITQRKTKKVTANVDALQELSKRYPLYIPIADAILEARSIGVFRSTFVEAQLDEDGRMRSSFNPAGPETFRLSSSENVFGSGMNLQNIPSGDRNKTRFKLPNIRKLFVPDRHKVIFDADLDRADLQVVVWEADDADLKRQLRLGVDLHIMNGILLAGKEPPDECELIETHANYPEHKARFARERQFAKNFVHGTNYGGKARTMSIVCGITVAHCEAMQNRWFSIHPGIPAWHKRVSNALLRTRTITNAFGYRRYYFERIENILPEALAWIPQSTVAHVINNGWCAVEDNMPEVEILLQVHDSLVGQFSIVNSAQTIETLRKHLTITVPYPDPLVIPVGFKLSTQSWGDCIPLEKWNATHAH